MKQFNIFGEIDHLDEDDNIKRCEWCKKSCEFELCDQCFVLKTANDKLKKCILAAQS